MCKCEIGAQSVCMRNNNKKSLLWKKTLANTKTEKGDKDSKIQRSKFCHNKPVQNVCQFLNSNKGYKFQHMNIHSLLWSQQNVTSYCMLVVWNKGYFNTWTFIHSCDHNEMSPHTYACGMERKIIYTHNFITSKLTVFVWMWYGTKNYLHT
jgi:hypothetical protein